MQIINRIQNVTINANVAVHGAAVVDVANARRAYPSFKPCDLNPVSKCPGQMSSSTMPQMLMLTPSQRSLTSENREHLGTGPLGRMWRHDSHQPQMPSTVWAALILNRSLCG